VRTPEEFVQRRKRQLAAPRKHARPHKVDPETGFCGGCDDALGIESVTEEEGKR
jgi:hypothetical protein